MSVFLAWESCGLLIGESADEASVAAIERATNADPRVDRVESLRTMHLGPRDIVVTMRVAFRPGDTPLVEAIKRLREAIQEAEPAATDITIEPEDAGEHRAASP